MSTYLKNLLQLILAPAQGWMDVAISKPHPASLARRCMYPLFAIASVAIFSQLLYHKQYSFAMLLIKAVVNFVSYFVTYFFASIYFVDRVERYSDGEPSMQKCQTVLVYAMGLMALASLICNLLPVSFGLSLLLPMAVALIIWKSDQYLRIGKEYDFHFALAILLAISLPPVVIQYVFDWLVDEIFV